MKYDFDIDLDHDNSLSLIYNRLKPDTMVLEFGPANGRLTKVLKENLNCEVYLAEIDVEAGKQAAVFAKNIVFGDIEEYGWAERYQNLSFDYILFADVLEHLRNPYEVLLRCRKYLKPDGRILLSVPNVAHNSIIIDLLKNRFEYSDIGLLDNTHIHFFTKESLEKMITQAGYFAVRKMATYSEVGTNEISSNVGDVTEISPAYWNGRRYGEVYQYVYEISLEEPAVCVDMIKAVNTRNYAQLYYGMDNYNEDESEKFYLGYNDAVQQMEFKFGQPVRKLRFDPYDGAVMVSLRSVTGVDESGGTVNVNVEGSNAAYVQDTEYIFTTEDPNIDLASEKPVVGIYVEMSVVSANRDELRKICGCYRKILAKQRDDLLRLGQINQRQIEEYNQLMAEKEQVIAEIERQKEEFKREKLHFEEERVQLEKRSKKDIENIKQEMSGEKTVYEMKIQDLNGIIATQQNVINQKDYILEQTFNSKSWKMTRIFRRK